MRPFMPGCSPMLLACAAGILVGWPTAAIAYPNICDSGTRTIVETVVLTTPCTVTGDLVVESGGTVFVNYRDSPQNHFIMKGNLVVKGNGRFFFAGGVLEFQQDFRQHREIRTVDQALFVVDDAELVMSQNNESKFMYFWARGSSQALFMNSRLDPTTNWLIAQMYESSVVRVLGSARVPTEIYLREQSSASAQYALGQMFWMELNDHSSGRIELPVQADSADTLIPYSFQAGRNSATMTGIEWQLDISDSTVNLGIESHPGSAFRVRGVGAPFGGELKVSYAIVGGTHAFSNLRTGLVNTVLDDCRLVLEHVQLGLMAWQMYARDADVLITNSVINEVGVDANARVRVESSVLQLATLASLGSGSELTIHGSRMYSQGVDVAGNGRLTIENTEVHGSSFQTYDHAAVVRVVNSAFFSNAVDCTFETVFDSMDGVPRCNPFTPPGAQPRVSGLGTATCVDTVSCEW